MANDNFANALKFVLAAEGGYVNDPRDNGGETNYGISKKAYPSLNIKNLTYQDVSDIYKRDYWDKCQCQYLSYPVALVVFDSAVNSGVGRASKWLQKAANVAAKKANLPVVIADGFIGPKTIQLVNSADQADIVQNFINQRTSFLKLLPDFGVFSKGWTKRVDKVYAEAMQHIDNGDLIS